MKFKKLYEQNTEKIKHANHFWEFIYTFFKTFNYIISDIDIKVSEDEAERHFKIFFISGFGRPNRGCQVEYDGFEQIFKYQLTDCEGFDLVFKREVNFIKQNI